MNNDKKILIGVSIIVVSVIFMFITGEMRGFPIQALIVGFIFLMIGAGQKH